MDNFVIFQGYIFSSKDDLKDNASQMYALIICNQTDEQLCYISGLYILQ